MLIKPQTWTSLTADVSFAEGYGSTFQGPIGWSEPQFPPDNTQGFDWCGSCAQL